MGLTNFTLNYLRVSRTKIILFGLPYKKKSIVKIPWSIDGYQMIILWYTLRKKGSLGFYI